MILKRVRKARLVFDNNGPKIEVERIGKGRYTEAFKHGNFVYLRVREPEYSKEILANITKRDTGRRDHNPHIPNCEFLESESGPYKWYQMPLYYPLTAKCKKAWAQFKFLKKAKEDAYDAMTSSLHGSQHAMANDINQEMDNLVKNSDMTPSLKSAIELLVNEAANYGEYLIEITKKNCAVDSAQNLILLDPLFDWDEVKTAIEKQRSRYA